MTLSGKRSPPIAEDKADETKSLRRVLRAQAKGSGKAAERSVSGGKGVSGIESRPAWELSASRKVNKSGVIYQSRLANLLEEERAHKLDEALEELEAYVAEIDAINPSSRPDIEMKVMDRVVALGEYAQGLVERYANAPYMPESDLSDLYATEDLPVYDSRALDEEMELLGRLHLSLSNELNFRRRLSSDDAENIKRMTSLEQQTRELEELIFQKSVLHSD